MRIALVFLLLSQDKPVKLRFDVQHMPADLKGKPRPLKPEEIRDFEAELKTLGGVKDALCSESTATVTLTGEAPFKLSELRMAGKKTLGTDAGKPVIVFNTIRLEGRVALTLHVEKNPEKVKDALKAYGEILGESGETYELKLKTAVPVLNVVKAVCAKTGADYQIFQILKDIHWLPPLKEPPK